MLWHYCSAHQFAAFTKDDLKNYGQFVDVIASFRKHYDLGRFSLRQLDIFLWLAGKDCFPKSYGKKRNRKKGQDFHNRSDPFPASKVPGVPKRTTGVSKRTMECG
jgi:hypothetical protein